MPTVLVTTPGLSTFTPPERVWTLYGDILAPGGGGKTAPGSTGGGGGGGGARVKGRVRCFPGTPIAIFNATPGTTGVTGGDSYINDAATLMAKGGGSGTPAIGPATGGTAAASIGETKFSGGTGGTGNASGGGGGGGEGAGSNANGSNGTAASGATGGNGGQATDGGDGGRGGDLNQPGTDAPGDGGGGGGGGESGQAGGSGRAGKISFTYQQKPEDLFDPVQVADLVYCFDMSDVDADGSKNAAYVDGQLMPGDSLGNVVWNMGPGGNLLRQVGGTAQTDPTLVKQRYGALEGNGTYKSLQLGTVASPPAMTEITNNQPFDLIFVFLFGNSRTVTGATATTHYLMGSIHTSSEIGLEIGYSWNNPGKWVFTATNGSAAIKNWEPNAAGALVGAGKKQIVRFTSNGTTWTLNVDGTDVASVGSLGTPTAAAWTNPLRIFASSNAGAAQWHSSAALFKLIYYKAQLTPANWNTTLDRLRASEGLP